MANSEFIAKSTFLPVKSQVSLACVASVSVGLSVRSRHFSLFWPREKWGERKNVHTARPNLYAAKKRKTPRTGGKP